MLNSRVEVSLQYLETPSIYFVSQNIYFRSLYFQAMFGQPPLSSSSLLIQLPDFHDQLFMGVLDAGITSSDLGFVLFKGKRSSSFITHLYVFKIKYINDLTLSRAKLTFFHDISAAYPRTTQPSFTVWMTNSSS